MKILQICPKPPMPLIDGGCIASHRLSLDLLHNNATLKILCYATEKHPYIPKAFDTLFVQKTKIEHRFVDIGVNVFQIIKNLFTGRSIQIERFSNKAFKELLFNHLNQNEYDFIILDGLMTGVYASELKKHSLAKVIYRAHNIEHKLFDQRIDFEENWLKKLIFKIQSNRLKEFEVDVWNIADHILCISEIDKTEIQNFLDNKSVSTYSFAIEPGELKECVYPKTLFHIGAMDWRPNIDGIIWFLENVFPKIQEKHANVVLHLAGKGISDYREQFQRNGVVVHEQVSSASEFMNTYDLMIIPLMVGSGVRIKALEAMSLGKVIISTKKGIEGINLKGDEVAVAKDAPDMVEKILALLEDDAKKISMQKKALEFVSKHHASEKNRDEIKHLLNKLKERE